MAFSDRVEVVDSHTEGEPTRVVIAGWGEVPGGTMAARREEMRRHQDARRRAVVCEPRGHAAMVGALLTPPVEPGSLAGVVFFDNAGYLGMCGHGTIGVVRTLDFLGRLPAGGRVRLDTPAGTVKAEIGDAAAGGPGAEDGDRGAAAGGQAPVQDGQATAAGVQGVADGELGAMAPAGGSRAVTIENVPARCLACDVTVTVPGIGAVRGDVAYGGNWFFIADVAQLPGLDLAPPRLAALTAATRRIRAALAAAGITGDGGAEIDHIEICGPPSLPAADSRNFVLCPGGVHDRSPCGTGTSAKLAVLHARGQLALGQVWRQEGFTGGCFSGWLSRAGEALVPRIRGRAHITSRATLHFEAGDPFREGFPSS